MSALLPAALASFALFAPASSSAPPDAAVDEERAEAEPDGGEEPGAGLSLGDLTRWVGGLELRLWGGGSAGAAPQVLLGAGGTPQVGVSGRLLWGTLEPEMTLGYGAFAGRGHTKLRLSVGTKVILALDDARPFLFVGYSHIHETLFEDIWRDPVGTTLTTAESVSHRSGAEVGAGLLLPVDVPAFGSAYRIDTSLKATAMYLPQLDKLIGLDERYSVPHDGYLLVEVAFGFPVLVS